MMSDRLKDVPTWVLWNVSKEVWLYHLQTTGKLQMLVDYYNNGIEMMLAANRDIVGNNQYRDIVNTELEVQMNQRDKTIRHYRDRLAELTD